MKTNEKLQIKLLTDPFSGTRHKRITNDTYVDVRNIKTISSQYDAVTSSTIRGYTEAIIVRADTCWGIMNLRFGVIVSKALEFVVIENVLDALIKQNQDPLARSLLPHITILIEASEPLLEALILDRMKSNFGTASLYDYIVSQSRNL